MKKLSLIHGLPILLLMLLGSCGPSYQGYGIVLLSEDEEKYQTGTIYPVVEQTASLGTARIELPSEEGPFYAQIDDWRIDFFETEQEAQEELNQRGEYATLRARSLTQPLPVRDATDNVNGQSIYRLRRDEIIRILNRATDLVEIGRFTNYWYEVLTSSGTRGYVYGENIELLDGTTVAETDVSASEAYLRQIMLEKRYYPSYFRAMVENKRYDLETFTPDFGFSIDFDQRTVAIRTPQWEVNEQFTSVLDQRGNRWALQGSSVILSVLSSGQISVQFSQNGTVHTEAFFPLAEDIPGLIAQENQRRDKLLNNLTAAYPQLASATYGTLSLGEDRRFLWSEAQILTTTLGYGTRDTLSGTFDASLYLASSLSQNWDGVLHFSPEGSGLQSFALVYSQLPSGLRFAYVPDASIRGIEVTRLPATPLIIFMATIEIENPEQAEPQESTENQ